ncbi:SGNH/GDSL hydrolase family protein [Actinomycetospora sp. NBRC 106378]|uniref:SGNH/GDSL hydrolase family protein n=1 Tax=Actinomycetospora sp. NBRC 106378 TaxID=3032208 RepID=UPI0024A1311C|nr:SGNH/GDSL hydrolase family protein [Actinomycetospora sp. NBRC 106378]GLZ51766.1 hypothetical protein Acsp07_13830 [Actinomycetospora sp. NBRC 106378]
MRVRGRGQRWPTADTRRQPCATADVRALLLAALLALLAGCASVPTPTTAADGRLVVPSDRPVALLVAGDSLAAGFTTTDGDRAFVRIIATTLGATVTMPPLRDQPLTTVDRVLDMPGGQDVVLVELGTNDIGRRTPAIDFRARYAALLDRAREGSPAAALVCLGTWAGDGGSSGGADYDTIISSLCAERAGRFVDLGPIYRAPGTRGTTDFHPDDDGHRMIADAVLGVLDTQEDP